jgi:Platelet-activating factor acetylhydrolase, isoform II
MNETFEHAAAVVIVLLLAANGTSLAGRRPSSSPLPEPSGTAAIGRRLLALTRRVSGGDKRTLALALWYPACKRAESIAAPYFPPDRFDHSVLQNYFGGPEIRISTHAHENASPCSRSAPLLLFSPGLGVPVYSYSAQFEELASHGYVVAAVQHPLEGIAVRLTGGARVDAGAEGKLAAIRQEDVDILANDILFVPSEIERRQRELGFSKFLAIGVFGHSIGGVVALRSCELDKRVKACLSDDGMYDRKPFFSLPNDGVNQPFLVLAESNPGLSDQTLASTHVTRAEFVAEEMKPEGLTRRMYEASNRGSYLIIITTPDVDHMSFTDLPLIKSDSTGSLNTFKMIGSITCKFFDAFAKGTATFEPEATDEVAVFRFQPAHR